MRKLIFALAIVAALFAVAMPAAAQGPVIFTTDQGPKTVFIRAAGTNVDPFGGLPLITSGGLGSASKFGVGGPGVFLTPGGKPSTESGDGLYPRRSIYLGGAWSVVSPPDQKELPVCATITIPAGSSRYFKMDTWKNKKLQIWLDDELNGAKAPSGSAVFGAGDRYMWGTWSGSVWQQNAVDTPGITVPGMPGTPLRGQFLEGFAMAVYDPDAMRPNYAYPPPNAALYTGGPKNERSSQGFPMANDGRGVNLTSIVGFNPLEAWAEYNFNQPSHLLWYEGHYDGWVHAKVYNQMIWDGTVSVCSYRAD